MVIDQILFGIIATLVALMPEIIVFLLIFLTLRFTQHKIQKKREKEEEFRGWLLVEVAIILILSFYVPFKFLDLWIGYGIVWGVITLAIAVFYSVYFLLAPNNCFFTFVREGTVKFVVKGDKFEKCLIQWKDHTFDEAWNIIQEGWYKDGQRLEVVEVLDRKKGKLKVKKAEVETIIEGAKEYKEPWHPFGGLRYYGRWPLFDIHTYEFRWVGVTEEGKEQPKKEWLDSMITKDDVYLCKIPRAEDQKRIPLDFQLFLTIRIYNPYKAKYAVQRWLETVLNRIQPLMRQYIAQYPYEDLLKMRYALGEEMRKKLEEEEVLKEFIDRYGVEVRAIEVREIEPPETFRTMTLKEREAEYEAMALVAKAKGEKTAIITKAEGEAERMAKTYGEAAKFGDNGFLLKIAEETKGKDVPALVLTHHLAARFEEILKKPGITKEEILKELAKLEEVVKKL